MARVTSVADAVVTTINAISTIAARGLVASRVDSGPSSEREAIPDGELRVLPISEEQIIFSRAAYQKTYSVGVNVLKPSGAEALDPDEWLAVCDEIKDGVKGTTASGAACIGVTHDPLYDADLLHQQRLFSANLLFQFREVA